MTKWQVSLKLCAFNLSDKERIEWKGAISSVVVCLGLPALRLRAHLYIFRKWVVLYIVVTAAGSQLG